MTIQQIKRLGTRKNLIFGALTLGILIVAIVVGVIVLQPRQNRPPAISLGGTPPQTGVSLLFSPSLTSDAELEIKTSDEKVLHTFTLVRSAKTGTGSPAKGFSGPRYNIPLSEGVYQLVIKSSANVFPPFTKTTTVSSHALTFENINMQGLTR